MRLAAAFLVVFVASIAFGSSSDKSEMKVDLSGKWKWALAKNSGGHGTFTLKQDGEKLTGSISGLGFGGENDIEDGTFKDGQITFKVTRSRGGQDITTTYTGKLSGDGDQGRRRHGHARQQNPTRVGSATRQGRSAETRKLESLPQMGHR